MPQGGNVVMRSEDRTIAELARGTGLFVLCTHAPMVVDLLLGDVPMPSGG